MKIKFEENKIENKGDDENLTYKNIEEMSKLKIAKKMRKTIIMKI